VSTAQLASGRTGRGIGKEGRLLHSIGVLIDRKGTLKTVDEPAAR